MSRPIDVLKWEFFFVYVHHKIGWDLFLVFGGRSIDFYPLNCLFKIRDFWPDTSRVGLLRRSIWKDADISNMVALTAPWRSLSFFVMPNWFLCTYAVNDDTHIVLSPCCILSRNFSSMPERVRNVQHITHFPDYLVAVALEIPLVLSMTLLEKISMR